MSRFLELWVGCLTALVVENEYELAIIDEEETLNVKERWTDASIWAWADGITWTWEWYINCVNPN